MRTPLLVLALIACGDDGVHHLADSGVDGPSQPTPDAPPDAPTPGVVTVTVTLQGSAAEGVPVYFQNADNSVVSSTTTGPDGTATATMAPGGFATVLEPVQSLPTLRGAGSGSVSQVNGQVLDTFSGVKPGDNLHVDVDPIVPDSQSITFDITIPTDPASPNTEYFIGTTCGSTFVDFGGGALVTSNVEQISLFGPCSNGSGATADFIVQSFDDSGNQLNSFFAPGVAIPDGGEVDLTGTYTADATQTFKLTNVPATVDDDEAFVVYTTSLGIVDDEGGTDSSPSGGSDTLSFGVPAANAAFQQANFLFFFPTGAQIDTQDLVTWGSASNTEIDTDVSTIHLHSWVTRPQLNVVTNQVEWSVEKTGASPDAITTQVNVNRFDPVADVSSDWTWNIAAGGATTDGAVPIPTLPTDIFDFNIHDSDSANVQATSGITLAGGYDALRGQIFDEENLLTGGEDVGTLSATGQLVTQTTSGGGEGVAAAKSTHRKSAHPIHRHRPTRGHGIGIVSSMFTTLRAAR